MRFPRVRFRLRTLMILVAVVAVGIGGYFEAVRLTTLRARYQSTAESHAKMAAIYEDQVANSEAGVKTSEEAVAYVDGILAEALTPQRREYITARRDYFEQMVSFRQVQVQANRVLARYNAKLSLKYARATRRPWQGMSPDPPKPAEPSHVAPTRPVPPVNPERQPSVPDPAPSGDRFKSEIRPEEITMRCDLSGKISLVTGAARGIGQAIADRLAANGSTVVYTDIDEAGARAAASKTSGSVGRGLDVTCSDQIKATIDDVVKTHGRLDVVVNNAGINTLVNRVTIDEFPRDEWDRILAVDLTGLYEVSRFAAQVMRSQKSGRIINIASIAGLVPLRLQCAFVAAKAGVVNLTKAMALELGPLGILVNGIAPGSTLTEGTRALFYGAGGLFHDSVKAMLAHVPLGRPGEVDEIAVAALFLADPENSYMNGHILTVDGGWTAGYAREF